MTVSPPPSGTVTFLFTDIEGSTRLWQEQPEAMRAALARHDDIVRTAVTEHHGHVVKTTGDGFHASFSAAHDAVNASIAAQRAIDAEDWAATGPLRVRIGIHTGPAELRDGDYYGTTVNRAARLMSIAHGGQVVCSQATIELLRDDVADGVELLDLGEHRLRDLARSVGVYQVTAAGLERDFPPLRSLDNSPTNLPVQPTVLVGRHELIAELAELVQSDALVTLTGVGGVGKTRLALEVGAEVLPRFSDGVWLVELAPLAHDEMVLQTIADVVGVAAQTGEPLATTLISRLRSKRLLIIIDNCEHVLSPVARLVDRLAASATGVRVLATSREPLGIRAERVRAVPPLAEGTEAVELFIDRATHAGATIDGADQLRAVAEICRRLDGIPLAIELAAARARMMAPTQIAERLGQRFRLLTGGGRTAVERHRTLQATVSWSYELLDEAERVVFQRLSTLASTFDLDAAEAIAAGGVVEAFDVLDAVGHLVDKSMVLAESGDGAVRYRLLETLRQFAADRLAEQPDAAEVQDRHAAYWRGRARDLGRSGSGNDIAAVLDVIDADLDNYRTALAHLLSTGRVDDAAATLLTMYAYWQIRRVREGLRWHHQVLAHPELDARLRLQVLGFVAQAEFHSIGDAFAGERHAAEAVELAEALGVDPPWGALQGLISATWQRRDHAAFRQLYEKCRRIDVMNGDRYRSIITESLRANGAADDELAPLVDHYEKLTIEVERHGDPLLKTVTALGFAIMWFRMGQFDRARERGRAALDRRSGPSAYGGALFTAAALEALTGGDHDWARTIDAEALRLARDEGLTGQVISGVRVAAALAAERADIKAAAILLGAAARYIEPLAPVTGDHVTAASVARAQAAIDAAAFDLETVRRQVETMTFDDLITYALETLA